jgi:hypothetical protein
MKDERNIWTMTEARSRFYEVLFAALEHPQTITMYGKRKYEIAPLSDCVDPELKSELAAKRRLTRSRKRKP